MIVMKIYQGLTKFTVYEVFGQFYPFNSKDNMEEICQTTLQIINNPFMYGSHDNLPDIQKGFDEKLTLVHEL